MSDKKDYVLLIESALKSIKADNHASAVWRLADALGMMVTEHGLEDNLGFSSATGRGWRLIADTPMETSVVVIKREDN